MSGKKTKPVSALGEAALAWAALGKPVFPCKNTPNNEEAHKAPKVAGGFHAATTDADMISTWWRIWPTALIGMATGKASGIAVLDLDVKKGKNGYAFVPDWETRSHVIAKTESGGAHLYFNAEGAPHCTIDTIAKGVDTKGDGGYVIVPPSPGYTWLNGSDLSNLPPWPSDLRPPSHRPAPKPPASVENIPREIDSSVAATPRLPDCLMDLIRKSKGGGISYDAADCFPLPNLARVKAALAVIDPDIGRTEWIAIGCGLYKHFGHDEGFEIWNDWSSGGRKYRPRRMNTEWRSIAAKDGYDYNIETVFYHANEADPLWWRRIEQDETALVEESTVADGPGSTVAEENAKVEESTAADDPQVSVSVFAVVASLGARH